MFVCSASMAFRVEAVLPVAHPAPKLRACSPTGIRRGMHRDENSEPEPRAGLLPGAVIVDGFDMLHRRDGRQREEPGHAGDMADEAGQPGMAHEEPRDRRRDCNFLEPALGGRCDEPRACYFPNFGGGGPSLKLSLRSLSRSCSSSSRRRCSSISAKMRLASSCSRM